MTAIFLHSVGLDRMIDQFEDLASPQHRTAERLDEIMAEGFAATEASVHVLTGRLKASGNLQSRLRDDEWRARITYGGYEHTGAPWEIQRAGEHDFLSALDDVGPKISDALDDMFRGTFE